MEISSYIHWPKLLSVNYIFAYLSTKTKNKLLLVTARLTNNSNLISWPYLIFTDYFANLLSINRIKKYLLLLSFELYGICLGLPAFKCCFCCFFINLHTYIVLYLSTTVQILSNTDIDRHSILISIVYFYNYNLFKIAVDLEVRIFLI